MVKKIGTLIFSILALIAVWGCNTNSTDQEISEGIDSLLNEEEMPIPIDSTTIGAVIENVSSPVEMAALVQSKGIPFSQKYLSSPDLADEYKTNFEKAFGLGLLGADLGYLNIYNKTSLIVSHLSSIRKLADDLRVDQFFDFQTLKRLASNNENLDSLMYISIHSFNRMDRYLRENNRGDHSALMIAGVWIESMYLATQVEKEFNDERIAESIGEQKIMLNELLLILKNYKAYPNFPELIQDFETIKEKYKDVTITYKVGEPESVEVDGRLVIQQNTESVVAITPKQLQEIIQVVEKIRNKRTK